MQDTIRTQRKRLERTYTHLNYDTRSSYYVGASAISVSYQLYSDECELIPGPDGMSRLMVSRLSNDDRSSIAPNLTPALIERSTVELIDPYTWTAIDGYALQHSYTSCHSRLASPATNSTRTKSFSAWNTWCWKLPVQKPA